MNIQVTSVSKKEQKLSQVAAAIYVITHEEIRRSAANNIPDLLRAVPGLDVAQTNANTWAISARGFNSVFANKLLVLIDGRSVYTPLTGGVNWDTLDVPLDDIDRIEVIRGPGATIWGANAVNGVINIITKKAEDTHGAMITGGGGNLERDFGSVRYGAKAGNGASYRVFAKYFDKSDLVDLNGAGSDDGWRLLHGGFRVDQSLSKRDSLTTQGDIYTGREGSTIPRITSIVPPVSGLQDLDANLAGGNVLSRWNHVFSDSSDATLQFYYDQYTRSGPRIKESRDTIDLDFQHHLAEIARNNLIWGAGYRRSSDQTIGTTYDAYIPAARTRRIFNSFVQDEITLKPERIFLTLGVKLEDHDVSGLELQPSVRMAWSPSIQHTFWGAISRASRTPDRTVLDVNVSASVIPSASGLSILLKILGSPQVKSEQEVAYELGYRTQPNDRLSFDLTAFLNLYSNLSSFEQNLPFVQPGANPPYLVLPVTYGNGLHGMTHGIEAAATWKLTRRWTLSPAYTLLQMHLHNNPTSLDIITAANTEGSDPHQQARLRSHVDLSHAFSWDATAYFVGPLPAQKIPSYTRLDTQLSWLLAEPLELRLVGQNLLRDHHLESHTILTIAEPTQAERSAYVKVIWRF